MAVLIVPPLDAEPWPTLGPQVCDLIEDRCIFGPGSLKGQPAVIDAEKRAAIYRMYEVYPQGHEFAGRRRFKRVGVSWRKGLAKTEAMAWIAFAELHSEGPVRCDGFDASGEPVGRPVRDPYIPLLAVTVEQVEELAYGALLVMCQEGPDADYFDSGLERIIRLDERGRADGKAVPLSNSPGSRDGARTTFQGFDEPHRLFLPRQLAAHETMVANLEKRVLEDPWGLYVGTAGEPGENSVAEGLHAEAKIIAKGHDDEPALFYFHREAGPGYDLKKLDERIAAVKEATGPVGEYGPGQFRSIAKQWDRPKADKKYLERVWLNRWTRSEAQAFDVKRWAQLNRIGGELRAELAPPIPPGALVTVGFDGARFRDSSGFVVTEISTGRQTLAATWEKPIGEDGWEIDPTDVDLALNQIHETWDVWRGNADPPHWVETVGTWAGRYPETWQEWWTTGLKQMAFAVRDYSEAIDTGAVTWCAEDRLSEAFSDHISNAGRKDINLYDDEGKRLYVLKKIHEDRKFDNAMAAVLSWQGRLEALRKGATSRNRTSTFVPSRIR